MVCVATRMCRKWTWPNFKSQHKAQKARCHVAFACSHLIVDTASLAALDIFKEEEHPSAMGIGSSKEGVSVYGLLQRCVTGMVGHLQPHSS